jgi:thiamine biosynthesis protein ThiI
MNTRVILIRYGEIALKSKPVRKILVRKLKDNIKTHFSKQNLECFIISDYGRIYLYCDDHSSAEKILRRIFGIVSFSLCTEISSEIDQILDVTKREALPWLPRGSKFAVRARRVGNHAYSSQSLAEEVGSAILSSGDELKVDLDNPDVEIFVEVRHDKAFVFSDSVKAPGGFPMGSQGNALAFVEDERDIAAAWLMMKRGCKVHIASTKEFGGLEGLKLWDPDLTLHKCEDIEELYKLCDRIHTEALVLGWDLDRALKSKLKHNVPIFYPLIGFDVDKVDRLVETITGSEKHADNETKEIA